MLLYIIEELMTMLHDVQYPYVMVDVQSIDRSTQSSEVMVQTCMDRYKAAATIQAVLDAL